MTDVNRIEGDFSASGKRFAIIVGRFNSFVVDHLLSGAIDCIARHGGSAKDIDVFYAPGSFELPLLAKRVAAKKSYNAVVALGAVIRGGTPHFDYVAGECTKGLAAVGLEYDIPVAFGVLTVDTIEQAIERSGTKAGNKGVEAAMSAIEMASLLDNIDKM